MNIASVVFLSCVLAVRILWLTSVCPVTCNEIRCKPVSGQAALAQAEQGREQFTNGVYTGLFLIGLFSCAEMFSANNKQQTQSLWMWRMEYLHHEQRPLYFGEWF